jgi:hypothetical protein
MINFSWTPAYPMVPSGQAPLRSSIPRSGTPVIFFSFLPPCRPPRGQSGSHSRRHRGPHHCGSTVGKATRSKANHAYYLLSERQVPVYLSISSDQVSRVHSCSHGTTYIDPALYYSRVLWGQLLTLWRIVKITTRFVPPPDRSSLVG